MNTHRVSPAGTDTRDLSIRGLPFRVFGELGLKRRYAAVALLAAGARAKTEKKAAKSGQKWPKVATHDDFSLFTDHRLLATGRPFRGARQRGVTKGDKRCQKVPTSPLALSSVLRPPSVLSVDFPIFNFDNCR